MYQVYYARCPIFMCDLELTPDNLLESHVLVAAMQADSPDQVYCLMQGENRVLTEADRKFIEAHEIHTSFSVGDVVRDPRGVCWECASSGWRKLAGDDDPSQWSDAAQDGLVPRLPRSERVIIPGRPLPG